MSPRLNSVSRFSPGNCEPELLESMLVARNDVVDRLERSVLDSVRSGAGHHRLLIGPRGVGKTHLLAVLYNRIHDNARLRPRVVIAYMKEEERGVASFLDWLVRILRAFHRRNEPSPKAGAVDLAQGLEALKQMPLDQAQAAAERLLLRFVGDRRLLLIVENLGELFGESRGMGREGQQRFRDLVQQHPFWTIVASSQSLFEDVQAREAPFYGFFKVRHLGAFDVDEAVALLGKLADLEERQELRRFFETEVGRGRIKAIHRLTGGNPRLLVIFYQFVDCDAIEHLATPFLEMVDSLTSYYQEQMQPLPALQQKIIEFLCEHRTPATVKDIAQSCFITHQTASAQLGRLAEKRYVVATKDGRQSFYELREPLFRICFEVKENMGYPIRLFVDFLGVFYSMEELKRKYRSASLLRSMYEKGGVDPKSRKLGIELEYLGEALSAYYGTGSDTMAIEVEPLCLPEEASIRRMVEDLISEADYSEAIKLADAAYDLDLGGTEFLLKSAEGRRRMGDLEGARERAGQLVAAEPDNLPAWIEKAAIEWVSPQRDLAESSLRRIIELDPTDVASLLKLARIYSDREEYSNALALFVAAIEGGFADFRIWLHRGVLLGDLGDLVEAERSFGEAIALQPQQASAWLLKGRVAMALGNYPTAEECFDKVTELQPTDGDGWRFLGMAKVAAGNHRGAIASFEQSIERRPDELSTWEMMGRLLWDADDHTRALECFERVTGLAPADAEGWMRLGLAQRLAGEPRAAERSYGRATELKPDSVFAWVSQGRLLLDEGEHRRAVECLQRAVDLQPDRGGIWLLLALAQERAGERSAARTSYVRTTDLCPRFAPAWESRGRFHWLEGDDQSAEACLEKSTSFDQETTSGWVLLAMVNARRGDRQAAEKHLRHAPSKGVPHSVREINAYLFREADIERLPEFLDLQRKTFAASGLHSMFVQGLMSALMELIEEHASIAKERLMALRDRIIPKLSDNEELKVACRLYTHGIDYLETKDRRVLLRLTREERQSCEELLQSKVRPERH